MSDTDVIEQLKARLAAMENGGAARPAAPTPPAGSMPNFNQPAGMPMGMANAGGFATAAGPAALGLLVPVSIPTPLGEVTAMVQFGPEYAASGPAAQQLIQQLMQTGWPVKAWQPKPQNNGFGGGGGRGRGGW